MAELKRPSKWIAVKNSFSSHKGVILIIFIIILAMLVLVFIIEEERAITGRVVDEETLQPPMRESQDQKTSYQDIIVSSS
jgi:hypothetical protein